MSREIYFTQRSSTDILTDCLLQQGVSLPNNRPPNDIKNAITLCESLSKSKLFHMTAVSQENVPLGGFSEHQEMFSCSRHMWNSINYPIAKSVFHQTKDENTVILLHRDSTVKKMWAFTVTIPKDKYEQQFFTSYYFSFGDYTKLKSDWLLWDTVHYYAQILSLKSIIKYGIGNPEPQTNMYAIVIMWKKRLKHFTIEG